MAEISRRNLLLLMLGIPEGLSVVAGVSGITRLQKFLFLLEREGCIKPQGDGFEFSAYKAGPYSARLYDDLELLENLGLVETEVTSEATEPEAVEVGMLSFDELISDEMASPDAYEEKYFRLTQAGKEKVEQLLASERYKPCAEGIRRIKSQYGHYSLNDLLYHVYTKYPQMATESEIKHKILKRRG